MMSCDVAVRGTGAVGAALALSLSRLGLSVRLVGAAGSGGASTDVRAFALNPASVALLRSLRVWEALAPDARTPVREMAVHGDAPGARLEFSAWRLRLSELAWIVDAAALDAALAEALRYAPHIERVDGDDVAGQPSCALTAYCEGRESSGRAALGVDVDRVGYGQRAIAARVVVAHPHQSRAWQWFRAPDVLALLPFDRPELDRSFALVWSMPDAQAAELLALDADSFAQRLQSAVARDGFDPAGLRLASERSSWPLGRALARSWCGPGWVLVGDSAHVVHPLAGQGLNLGLADVATLARVIGERESWRGIGDEKLLRRYARERAAPTWAMLQVTDGLQNLFAHPSAIVREGRNRGLALIDRIGPAKRWLAGQALGR
jgi:2-polyprenyl-6-methoxyphenol hydroxylase-like FAD-dependent oxidoreductase